MGSSLNPIPNFDFLAPHSWTEALSFRYGRFVVSRHSPKQNLRGLIQVQIDEVLTGQFGLGPAEIVATNFEVMTHFKGLAVVMLL